MAKDGFVHKKFREDVAARLNRFKRGDEDDSDALDRALGIAERRIAETQGTGQEP